MTRNRKQLISSTILSAGFATIAVIGVLYTNTNPLVGLIHLGVAVLFAAPAIRWAKARRATKGQPA